MNAKLITLTISGILLASVFTVIANDQFIYDESFGNNPSIIKITNNIYAIAYTANDNKGVLKTIGIANNGEIEKREISSFEFDSNRCDSPKILRVFDNIYAVAYSSIEGKGCIKTISIDNNGIISEPVICSFQFAKKDVNQLDFINFFDEYYGVAYGDQGTLKVLKIDNSGIIQEISEYVSGISFSVSDGLSPDIFEIKENIFGIAFTGDSDTGCLVTFSIYIKEDSVDYNGIEYAVFDNLKGLNPYVIRVNYNIYAICYTSHRNNGNLLTLNIDSSGEIVDINLDNLIFDGNRGLHPDILFVSENIFAISYTGKNNDGFVKTLEISPHGEISDECIDSIEYDETQGLRSDIIDIYGDYYGIAYSGSNNKGILKTLQIDSRGNIFIDQRTCDVDSDSNEECARNLDWNKSNGYEDYFDEDGSSNVLVQIDGDSDRKYDFFINTGFPDFYPDVYWDPDDNIVYSLGIEDIDYDGTMEYIYDSNNDGSEDNYFDPDNGQIHQYITYSLTIDIDGMGSVSTEPDGTEFLTGTEVLLNAIPDKDWSFDHWEGDLTDEDNETSVIIDSDKFVTACFIEDIVYYNLSISTIGNGSTNPFSGVYTYKNGTIVDIEAIAETGWCFSHWSGDLTGSNNQTSITMDSDKFITANFERIEYSLTVTTSGNGLGTVNMSSMGTYYYGDEIALNAVPSNGSHFVSWSGDLSGSSNPEIIFIDSDKIVDAQFDLDGPFNLTISTSGSGNGSVEFGPSGTYYFGDVVTIWANASNGSEFVSWSGDLSGNSSPETIIMDSDKSVDAQFDLTPKYHTLTISVVGNGTTNPCDGVHSYLEDTIVNLEAFSSVGWSFSHWSGDFSGSTNPVTISMDSDKIVIANFVEDSVFYDLSVCVSGNGTTSPSVGVYSYLEGTTVDLEALPSIGWKFDSWSGDISDSDNHTSITMDKNKTVTANFNQIEYFLNITTSGTGTGEVLASSDAPYQYGDIVTLTANADNGSSFDHWSGDLSGSNNPETITFNSDKNINANFSQNINYYDLVIQTIGNGTTSPSIGNHSYPEGYTVNIEAFSSVGWSFSHWSSDITGPNNQTSITMDSDKFITANFERIEYSLTVTTSGNGLGIVDYNSSRTLYYGDEIALNAVPSNGSHFVSWSGDLSGSKDFVTIFIDSNKTVDAQFDLDGPFHIIFSIGGNGSGYLDSSPIEPYYYGDVVTIWANASNGSEFVSWSGDLSGNNSPENVLMNSNKTISAWFVKNPVYYNLTVSVVGNGTTTPSVGVHSYLEGSVVNIEAFSSVGWSFSHWSGDINSSNNQSSIVIDSNKCVTANFIQLNNSNESENDTEKPSNITGLSITDEQDGKLRLSWDEATDNNGIKHYEVWRDGELYTHCADTSYLDTGLENKIKYSYKIRAVDTSGNLGAFSETINASSSPSENKDKDNNVIAGGGGGMFPPMIPNQNNEEENKRPIADASATKQKFAYIFEDIEFNASKSSDTDGEITDYIWDFDDGTNKSGKTVIHNYSKSGQYNVTLTVIDDNDQKNLTFLKIMISKPNIPPEKPIINGPSISNLNENVSFEISSTDKDGINLTYIIHWGDGSKDTELNLIPAGKTIFVNHSWNKSGNYSITVKVIDEDFSVSQDLFEISIEPKNSCNNIKNKKKNDFSILVAFVVIILSVILSLFLLYLLKNRKRETNKKEDKEGTEKNKNESKSNKQNKPKNKKGKNKKNLNSKKSNGKKIKKEGNKKKKNNKTKKKKSKFK